MNICAAFSFAFSVLKKHFLSKTGRSKLRAALSGFIYLVFCCLSVFFGVKLFGRLKFLGCEYIFPYVVFTGYLVCSFAFGSSSGLAGTAERELSGRGAAGGANAAGGADAADGLCAEGGTGGRAALAAAVLLPFYLLHLVPALPLLLLPCLVYLICGGFQAASAIYFVFCSAAAPFIPLSFSFAVSRAVKDLKKPRLCVFKAAASLVAAGGMFIYELPFLLSVDGLFDFCGFLAKYAFPVRFFERALSGSFAFFALYLAVTAAFSLLLFVFSLRNTEKIPGGGEK